MEWASCIDDCEQCSRQALGYCTAIWLGHAQTSSINVLLTDSAAHLQGMRAASGRVLQCPPPPERASSLARLGAGSGGLKADCVIHRSSRLCVVVNGFLVCGDGVGWAADHRGAATRSHQNSSLTYPPWFPGRSSSQGFIPHCPMVTSH